MRGFAGIHPSWGLTAVRVAMGLVFIVAGYKKWAEGIGLTVGRFASWDIPLPGVMGPWVGILELVGGVLLLVGLFTRWLGLLYAIQFAVAAFWVKFRLMGWDAGRIDLLLLASGLLLFLNGSGKAAIDEVWLEQHA